MAPSGRRSKQNSSRLSAPPLPGIAFGLFAAVAAAGFAASHTLRKKRRHAQSLQEQEANVLPEEFNLTSELKEEVDEKIVDAGEKEKYFLGEDTQNTIVEIGASISVDEASMDALQRDILIDRERDDKDEEKEGDNNNDEHGDDDNDTGVDGDDDRSSIDEELYPVLINGKLANFLDEIPVSKDIPEILLNNSNSFSDSVSESSAQEITSAPVKPFTSVEDSDEVSWPMTKSDLVITTSLISVDVDIDSPNFNATMFGVEKAFPEKEVGQEEVSFYLNRDVMRNEEKVVFAVKENQVRVEELEVQKDELQEDEIIVGAIVLDEGDADSVRINSKILSASSCAPDEEEDGDKCSGNSDLNTEEKSTVEAVRINGKVLLNDCALTNGHEAFEVTVTDPTPPKQAEQGTDFDTNSTTSLEDGPNPPQQEPPSAAEEQNVSLEESEEQGALFPLEESEEQGVLFPLEESEEQGALLRGPLSPSCEEIVLLEESVSSPNEKSLENARAFVSESFGIEQVQPCFSIMATQAITGGNDIGTNREGEDEVKCQSSTGKDDELSSSQVTKDEKVLRPITSGSDEESTKDENGFVERIIAESKVQDIIPMSMEYGNGTILESKELTLSSDLIYFASSNRRDSMQPVVDRNAFEAALPKKSKFFEHLPLEIVFLCLLVASISIVLWYLLAPRQVQG